MREYSEQYDFNELFLLALQGEITPEQMKQFNHILSTDPSKIRAYVELMEMYTELSSAGSIEVPCETDDSVEKYDTFLQTLANEEKVAPEVEIPKEQPQHELIQKVVYPARERRKISKFAIFTLVNVAAMILFILFINLLPPKGGVEVVTLSDSMNAKWADVAAPMVKGTRMATGSDWLLRSGMVELEFDNKAKVTLEGPVEFQILAHDRIGLNFGKLYAVVPNEAIGFSVYAQNAKVIDMGTEFGVQAAPNGDTQLHVIKGKTMLLVSEKSKKSSIEVIGGFAKKVSDDGETVMDIPYDEAHFVRAFDSEKKVTWRKQPSLDLADMVRNGNGTGTGDPAARLDPMKGFTNDWHIGIVAASNEYLLIPDNPFIDGIFVPDGGTSQIVSSRGDAFKECPDTSGLFDIDLFANPKPEMLKTNLREGTIRFDGQEYTDESGKPCVIMHANHGLTFDLDAMRKSYHRSIDRFTSMIGIADLNEPYPCNADFYVLIDGQVRYSLRQYKQKGVLNDVLVEIKDTDRFLTLVTTDGGDPDYPEGGFYKRAISCDWCVFTEPVLMLE